MRPVEALMDLYNETADPRGAWPLHRFPELGSTNDEARRRAGAGAPHGTTVVTRKQTNGRGRGGRSWHAPAGEALAVSIVVRDLHEWTRLPLVAAVAVARTVGPAAAIKWPNDIVFVTPTGGGEPDPARRGGAALGGRALRKVSGILCEGRPQEGWGVAGIGLNVALDLSAVPDDIAARAGTMGRRPSELDDVLEELLTHFRVGLEMPFDDLLAAWSERDALYGATVGWTAAEATTRTGEACGIDDRGRLRVRSALGSVAYLDAGEVHLRSAQDGALLTEPGAAW